VRSTVPFGLSALRFRICFGFRPALREDFGFSSLPSPLSLLPSPASNHNQSAGGPIRLETITEISFSPTRKNLAASALPLLFQFLPSSNRELTGSPLILTVPSLKARACSFAAPGTVASLNEWRKVTQNAAASCSTASKAAG
jgi:hypothetical protein